MAVYSVFAPPPRAGALNAPEKFVFVRDGFSWGAFIFGPLWMLWHRLWLVFVGFLVGVVAIEAALRASGVSANGRAFVMALIALLVGLEAPSLRRWTLVRNGWRELGLVVADDLEAAERRFFHAWVAREGAQKPLPPPTAPMPPPSAAAPAVIGLFPEPGAFR